MGALLERLGVERPIVQAGMGGGIARHELAATVSDAGGLGMIGALPAAPQARELAQARRLTGRPIAVNLLLPFATRAHGEVIAGADAVVTFWGKPERPADTVWLHQCGSVEEALAAQRAGADGVIAQGVEAGGHVRGVTPAAEILERTRDALPGGYPVLSAGGIADADDVARSLEAGAEAAVLGTRFLLSEESRAHPGYKAKLIEGGETVLTELFGLGWPAAPHRVVPNAATARWTSADRRGPSWVRLMNRSLSPLASRAPQRAHVRMAALQRPGVPIFSPQPPIAEGPGGLIESGPLYAGETTSRISELRDARSIVAELSAS
jgi:NAD(P)H-dependent flavin oxidoreductase YrpB (nitropropane dioxygenase family)